MILTKPTAFQELLDRPQGSGMVVSCYADTSVPGRGGAHGLVDLKAKVRGVRKLLADRPKEFAEFERQWESIQRALESPGAQQARGMAVFGATDWDQPLSFPSETPYESRIVVDEEPYLVPLLVSEYRRRAYLAVLTDSHRARLYACVPGEAHLLEEWDVVVAGKDRDSGRRWRKGEASIDRHRKDQIRHDLNELAQLVERAWTEGCYQGIVLLGEHEVLEHLRKTLPPWLLTRVVHEAPHAWTGEQPEISEQVSNVIDAAIAGQQERILAEIGRRRKEGYAVASGPQEVIVAMSNGQVVDLIVGPDLGEVGSRCSGCRSLLAYEASECPYCKATCAKVSLWQEILTRAVQHGIPVHFATAKTSDAVVVPGGVTALLARDEPQWAPALTGASDGPNRGD